MNAGTLAAHEARQFFRALDAHLHAKRAALPRRWKLAFAVVDAGAFLVDTHSEHPTAEVWSKDADVSVVCNARTLSDLAAGRFDPAAPGPEHLFVWGGEADALLDLSKALAGGASALAVRTGQGGGL
jgi:hypothetical protein